jgi:hypothetical protein
MKTHVGEFALGMLVLGGPAASPVWGQVAPPTSQPGVGLSVSGVALQTRGTALFGGSREVITGTWTGVAAELRLGLLVFEGVGTRGTLSAAENTFALQRDGGEMRGIGRLEVQPWLWLEGGYGQRAFDSPAGYQRWTIPALGLAIAPPLGHRALRAHVRGHYLPSPKIEGQEAAKTAFAVEAGLTARPPRVPVIFRVLYRLERYDFPAAAGRIEQFDALHVSLGLRVGQ